MFVPTLITSALPAAARNSWRTIFLAVCLFSVALLPLRGAAAPAETDFETGNRFYEGGKFGEAIAAYEDQVQHGEYSANLFYNLANAYFRRNERGRAILNYQRALILDPNHAEAAANLAFLRARVPGGPAEETPFWRQKLAALPVDDYVLIAAAAFWLAAAGGLWGAFSPGRRAMAWSLAAGLLLVGGASAGAVWQLDDGAKNASRAVVLEDQTKALYAPADNSSLVSNLAAGAEVRALGEHGDWVYIQLPEGKRAWVPAGKVARVIPEVVAAEHKS